VESAPVTGFGNGKKDSPLAGYQWEPGESGNPAGRPKTRDLKAEVRAFADEEDPKLRKTRLRQWLEMADRRARQGSPKHLEMLLSYGWGRPSQAIEVEGDFNFTDALTSMRAKKAAEEADATIRQYFGDRVGLPGLPVASNGNGNGHAQPAEDAASVPEQDLAAACEDDSQRQADAAPQSDRIRVEL
jgi:hypothetical protein